MRPRFASTRSPDPVVLSKVLRDEMGALGRSIPDDSPTQSEQEKLSSIYQSIHKGEPPLSALCLSGGGIRSATIGLGILQALARIKLLHQFDYLSTVSGGGFIGSWLTGWIHRHPQGLQGVLSDLQPPSPEANRVEARPIRRLREYSNYLTPRTGVLSMDTWAMVGTVLRNMLLNWLVVLPLITAALLIPRLYIALEQLSPGTPMKTAFQLSGWFLAMAGLFFAGRFRPSTNRNLTTGTMADRTWVQWTCVIPLVGAGVALTLYLSWHGLQPWSFSIFDLPAPFDALEPFILFGIAANMSSWLVSAWESHSLRFGEGVAIVVTGALGGAISYGLLCWHFVSLGPNAPATALMTPLLYAVFAVPSGLLAFLGGSTLFVGFVSKSTTDEDREWWGRFGGWLLVVCLVWIGLTWTVVYGVDILRRGIGWFLSAGTTTGVLTWYLGHSSSFPLKKEPPQAGKGSRVATAQTWILRLAPLVFVWILLAFLALGTSELLAIAFPGWMTGTLQPGQYAGSRHEGILLTTHPLAIVIVLVALIVVGCVFATFVNINKFSLHSMYRDRLVRAYLGASNNYRQPNPFTGFDEGDNIQFFELRGHWLRRQEIVNPDQWLASFRDPGPPVVRCLGSQLSQRIQTQLLLPLSSGFSEEAKNSLVSVLIVEINELLRKRAVKRKIFQMNGQQVTMVHDDTYSVERAHAHNWDLLCKEWNGVIDPSPRDRGLFPVINCALNLVAGDDLAWQQRKAQSFTFTPLHSGTVSPPNHQQSSGTEAGQLGYRSSAEFGDGITLGTGVAISGAAVSPNMGYHSAPLVTFLLTLFNARLGWWLGNPGIEGRSTYGNRSPSHALVPLLSELFGYTNSRNKYIHLSDGGHFENLGLYEMIRRRCGLIVVCDAGCDPSGVFTDLGNAVQKVRVDFGVEINIESQWLRRLDDSKLLAHCAYGTIDYSRVDAGARVGELLYIKPMVAGQEPPDVLNYYWQNQRFPHDPTADQWFSEAQFESYRRLGEHMVAPNASSTPPPPPPTVQAFISAAKRSNPKPSGKGGNLQL